MFDPMKMPVFKKTLVGLALLTTIHCKSLVTEPTDLLITNGSPLETDDLPAVVMLVMDNGVCTGTFINDYQVLTAAHCVEDAQQVRVGERKMLSPLFGYKTIATATQWRKHPLFKTEKDFRYDLAVVDFPRGSSRQSMPITSKSPHLAQNFTIVGYGHNEIQRQMLDGELVQSGRDFKRKGQNKIENIARGEIRFLGTLSAAEAQRNGQAPGQRSLSSVGDSGGPMINSAGELMGVSSAAEVIADSQGRVLNYWSIYTDLSSPDARAFLQQEQIIGAAAAQREQPPQPKRP